MGEWVSPTSHGGVWYSAPTDAYDGDTATYTHLLRENGFILYPSVFISCSKVRLWASVLNVTKADLTVLVYYAGAYHEIFDGMLDSYTDWVEIAIGSTQIIENVRIVPHTIILPDCLHEFEFWKEAEAPTVVYGDGAYKVGRNFQRF